LTSTTDTPDPQASHWLSTSAPQVLVPATDLDGNPLHFRSDLRIDIASAQLGRALWRMAGEPEPIRKRRRVIGYVLLVGKVIEREYDDLLNQRPPLVYSPTPADSPAIEVPTALEGGVLGG
jgi:hypothetical protein